MPALTACPPGETLPIADGVCLTGFLDPASGCCIPSIPSGVLPSIAQPAPTRPSSGNVLVIPSVAPAPVPTPPSIVYSGSPVNPRGLPPTAATGFAAAIPILESLLGAAFGLLLQKFLSPGTTTPTTPSTPAVPCSTPPPCRPGEKLDSSGKCCKPSAASCPSGEFPQPCRVTETIDAATGCCRAMA